MSNPITKFYLYAAGDPSTGIQSTVTEMDLKFDVDCNNDREWLRGQLTKFFSDIYPEPVGIEFEDEMQERTKKEDEFYSD